MIIKLTERGGGPVYETDVLHHVEIDGELIAHYADPAEVLKAIDQHMRQKSGHRK